MANQTPTICLTMIVKNESQIIIRCLEAAKFCYDYVSIVDTGSTDNTVKVIEDWFKKNNVNGKVHYEPWKNFGYNRTHSYKKAKESFPQATYLLLLDADMVLMDRGFKKSSLKGDSYVVYQKEGGTTYRNKRLIRAALNYHSVSVTHEYTAVENGGAERCENLDTLFIDDRSDGGCKDDKLDRDAALLIQGLKDEPDNSRYMFYLANTFYSLNQYIDAIRYYEERLKDKKNTFEEEAWYSCYRLGQCYEKAIDYPMMVYWYMKAINRRPHRIEPYICLAKQWIFNDGELQFHNGCKLVRDGLAVARHDVDLLFVEDSLYDWDAWFCLVVGCYHAARQDGANYAMRMAEGKAACKKVIESKLAPDNVKAACQDYLKKFYSN